jgi:hypothetical protein
MGGLRHHAGFVVLLCVLVLGPATSADAALRSPHLSESCNNGRDYAEYAFGPWRVEGCTEAGTPQDDETARRRFYGNVELNGMIVEGNSPLIATTTRDGDRRIHRIERDSSKLVLDPVILERRARIVLYSGELDLELTTDSSNVPGIEQPANDLLSKAATEGSTDTVDLPVSGVPALLGLRVRDEIEDAKVTSGGVGDDPGSIEFKPPMSLGATASALMRDWEAKVKIKTIDGQGMTLENLRFSVPDMDIDGIGGFRNFVIRYSGDRNEWQGSTELDLGELLFEISLEVRVDGADGSITRLAGEVDNLNIPVGDTGIFLQSVNALFQPNPLFMSVGASATAGPEFAGLALIEMSGQLDLRLEDSAGNPAFRLEVDGDARVFPTDSNSQLATGDMHIVIDDDGFISIGGGARYDLLAAGLGISADMGGSGAYSTTDDIFNIEAHATGRLHLGFLGTFDVVRFAAVTSSNGWGTCGNLPGLLFLVKAGIGQDWDRNPELILGCDLSPFDANVPGARKAQEPSTMPARVAEGVDLLAIEATADGPEPTLSLVDPGGKVVATSTPLGMRAVGDGAAVIAQPGSNTQYFFVRRPTAGTWTVRTADGGPKLTGLRTARDMPPVHANVSVRRVKGEPGRRRLRATGISGLARGEQLEIGVRTPSGIAPVGTTTGTSFTATFEELGPGRREIVASVLRNGVPLPPRTRTIARYTASLPAPARSVSTRRRGTRVAALAQLRRGAEPPDQWQYVLRAGRRSLGLVRSRPGQPVRFKGVNPDLRGLTVRAQPVVRGRTVRGSARTVRVGR